MIDEKERYSRQQDIVPAEKLASCYATVIGVGAIGRQVALQLAAIGVRWLQLIDFDVVETGNLAAQGFLESDLGKLKVYATADLCTLINGHIQLTINAERFKRSQEIGNVVFVCVDAITTRSLLWDTLKHKVDFLVDGRMSAEVIRVLTASDSESRRHYPTTLFASEEAHTGSCTAKTTIYSANIAAGLMLAQFTKWLRGLPVDGDVQVNLIAGEMTVAGR